jgi:tRNA (guanosine-2'-O-)-methyltransferase
MPGGPRADHRRISVLPTGAWRVKPEAVVETQTCPGRRQRAPYPSPPAHTGKPSLNPELMIQAERFHRIQAILARRQPDLTVVMEQVNKEHNFSAVLRNCDAVGVLDVHAIPPRHGLKLSGEISAGAAKWIRVHRHRDARSAVGAVKAAGMQIIAAHPDPKAVDFREVDFTQPTAILVGAERWGLQDDTLAQADMTTVIPMVGMVRSLNVSVATALLLYEAQRQREAAGMYAPDPSRIPEARRQTLLFEWTYPRIAHHLRRQGFTYPDLGPDGEILGALSGLLKEETLTGPHAVQG